MFATFLKFDIVSKLKETGRQIEIVRRQEGAETKQRWKREQRVMEPGMGARNRCQEPSSAPWWLGQEAGPGFWYSRELGFRSSASSFFWG